MSNDGCDNDDDLLFSESNSRFIVTVAPEKLPEFEEQMKDIACTQVGKVTQEKILKIRGANTECLVETELSQLRQAFKSTLHGV